ncbi:histidine phosphatase family protein [Pseudarthrobacter sp. P1]|uniref:histidine phosphatase family protein n=1 Tax=Pseudarthrobacter sp. P1 TaxID=3418418 RepID=UPI003CF2F435
MSRRPSHGKTQTQTHHDNHPHRSVHRLGRFSMPRALSCPSAGAWSRRQRSPFHAPSRAPMRLIVIGYGESDWTLPGRYTHTTDVGLIVNGPRQAAELGSLLERVLHGRSPAVVAPRRRAIETAALALPERPAMIDTLAPEYDFGGYEGLAIEQIRLPAPGWIIWHVSSRHGKSTADIGNRADAVLHAHGKNCPRPVVHVTHGHFARILAARALGLAAEQGRLFGAPLPRCRFRWSMITTMNGASHSGIWIRPCSPPTARPGSRYRLRHVPMARTDFPPSRRPSPTAAAPPRRG